MSTDFRTLIRSGVGEPDHVLDPDALLHKAKQHRTVRRASAAAVTAAVVATAVAVPLAWPARRSSGPAGAGGVPGVAAIDHPTGPLPAAVRRGTHHFGAPVTGSRVAVDRAGQPLYLVASADQVALVLVSSAGDAAWSMTSRSDLTTRGLLLSRPQESLVAVADGYSRVRTAGCQAAVMSNVAVLPCDARGTYTMSGPGMRTVTVAPAPQPASTRVQTQTFVLVAVPHVVGLSQAEAVVLVTAAGLRPVVTMAFGPGRAGLIRYQSPTGGSEVGGGVVQLTVNLGPVPRP